MRKKKNLRKQWYHKLVERDGEKCRICGRTQPEVYLEIDHVDGNKNNNPTDGSNYQLLCRRHNRMKDPRGPGKKKKVIASQFGIIESDQSTSTQILLNRRYEPVFRHWLYETMKKRGIMTAKEVIFEGAEHVGCAPFTIRTGYLPKVTSREGIYRQYFDEKANVNMVSFRDAKAAGIDLKTVFVDEPTKEINDE